MNSIKTINYVIGFYVGYFVIRLLVDSSKEAEICSFMAITCLLIVSLLLFHINITNKQLKDEIDKKSNNNSIAIGIGGRGCSNESKVGNKKK